MLFEKSIILKTKFFCSNKINDHHYSEVSEMEIEWTKILEKPDAKYKVDGNTLLKIRVTNEKLSEELESLRKKYANLENQNKEQKETIENLTNEINVEKSKIGNLESEGQEKISGLENQLKDIAAEKESEFKTQMSTIEETIKQNQTEIEKLQGDISSQQDQLNEKISKITELESLNNDLTEKNKTLSDRLSEVEPALNESEALKTEIEKSKTDLEEKLSEISQLNEKIKSLEENLESQQNNNKQELEALQQKQSEELEALKVTYESQLKEIKEVRGVSAGEAELTGEEQVVMLRYTGTDFLLVKKKPDEGIVLIMDAQDRKWLLSWDTNSSFIDRRTAERRARSIAKSGWALPKGARLGMGFEFEIQGDKKIPERLLRDQHEYME